jgi:hypothetical protein
LQFITEIAEDCETQDFGAVDVCTGFSLVDNFIENIV